MQGVLILGAVDMRALIEAANMRLEELARRFVSLEGAEFEGGALASLRRDVEAQRRLVNLLEEADCAALAFGEAFSKAQGEQAVLLDLGKEAENVAVS